MTDDDITTAFGQHLVGMTGCPPVAWPNGPSPSTLPHLIVRHEPVSRVEKALAGGGEQQVGFFFVTVVSTRGAHATVANTLAQSIAARFTKALRLPAGGGAVLIAAASEPATGFHDKAENWCVPVRIRYRTEA